MATIDVALVAVALLLIVLAVVMALRQRVSRFGASLSILAMLCVIAAAAHRAL